MEPDQGPFMKNFNRFLRQTIGGRSVGDRWKLLRDFLTAEVNRHSPHLKQAAVEKLVTEHFEAYQKDPPAVTDAFRRRVLTFQDDRRATIRKSKARRAAETRWQNSLKRTSDKAESTKSAPEHSSGTTNLQPSIASEGLTETKPAPKHRSENQNYTQA